MKYFSLQIFLIASLCSARAQEFTINQVEVNAESLIVHYDLIDTVKARVYTITVFSSKDNFLNPLQKVKGDVGLEVKPGTNKKIIWSAKEELGATFKGEMELEVRGKVYIPFVKFNDFDKGRIFKRGRPTTLTWAGGTRQNILNFKLYKGDELITVIPNVANSGNYDLVLPTSVKAGDGYHFIIADSKNRDQMMITPEFGVRRKYPLLLKAVPVVLIGSLIPLLIPEPAPDEIESPFDPPGDKN